MSEGEVIKCLLVDDLEENLIALESLLRRPGLELIKASSARHALEILLTQEVALALVDVQMPEMDGFELAELMRGNSRTRSVPIIFLTAGSRDLGRVFQGYDAGAVDFLFKPIEPRILRNKVETFFRLYEQRRELAQKMALLNQSQAERERLTAELAETLRFNETFVAVVGHDLRNPLNAILMGVEILQRQGLQGTPAATVRQIRSSGDRMRRMLEDLADLARARLAGGIPVQREPVDLIALSRKVVAEHVTSYPDRRIELRGQGSTLGSWDGPRIEQVLANLLGNALRHGASDGAVEVRVDGSASDAVLVSIHNLGHIPEQILPSIFHPFRSGQVLARRAEGLGLGLYIAQQLVFAHDGSVEVHSQPNSGTTFTVRLPRASRTQHSVFATAPTPQ